MNTAKGCSAAEITTLLSNTQYFGTKMQMTLIGT